MKSSPLNDPIVDSCGLFIMSWVFFITYVFLGVAAVLGFVGMLLGRIPVPPELWILGIGGILLAIAWLGLKLSEKLVGGDGIRESQLIQGVTGVASIACLILGAALENDVLAFSFLLVFGIGACIEVARRLILIIWNGQEDLVRDAKSSGNGSSPPAQGH